MLSTSAGGGSAPVISVVETPPFWPIALFTVVVKPVNGVASAASVVVITGVWRVIVTVAIALTSAAGSMVALVIPANCWALFS